MIGYFFFWYLLFVLNCFNFRLFLCHSFPIIDCVNYPTCTTCNDNPACGWCSGLSYCTSLPANCSAYDNCGTFITSPSLTFIPSSSLFHLFLLLFLFLANPLLLDAHCFNELSCLDCTAERGCAWCPTSDTCHSIDSTICGKELATQCSKHWYENKYPQLLNLESNLSKTAPRKPLLENRSSKTAPQIPPNLRKPLLQY